MDGEIELRMMSTKKEFGDFQTPQRLAESVIGLIDQLFGCPKIVIEPTAGLGAFLQASVDRWQDRASYEGYEINPEYCNQAQARLAGTGTKILQRDFFREDWAANLARFPQSRLLVVGNPPWVTNSTLGQLGSSNLPLKSNFQGLRGFEARSGKSNFDIAEWILMRLIEVLPTDGVLAMLCKTMTARRVLSHFWKSGAKSGETQLFRIDAKAHFGAAIDACLLVTTGRPSAVKSATVYASMDLQSASSRIGFVDGNLVSDMDRYEAHQHLDGGCTTYAWRSGIKHDAADVMEFSCDGLRLINGFGEEVDIEDEYVFPLLKSSDVGNGRCKSRKAVLVTQRHTGCDTAEIANRAPKTWAYLHRHASALDARRSSIYRNRPKFAVFGVGSYSFAPWKVACSGMYKTLSFLVVPPYGQRPVLLDDTCYSISFQLQQEAELIHSLLSSDAAKMFLSSLIFTDSKRPITLDVLKRLSFVELARESGQLRELQHFVQLREGKGQQSQVGTGFSK
jgi:hypothetical protein